MHFGMQLECFIKEGIQCYTNINFFDLKCSVSDLQCYKHQNCSG